MVPEPFSRHDERSQPLTVLLVVDAEHRGLCHLRMTDEHLLDLDRVDVLTAGDDHLVVTADHEQTARFIEVADVSRRHEAVVEVLRRT